MTAPTSKPDSNPEADTPLLRTDIKALKPTTHLLEPLNPPKSWLAPPSATPLPTLSTPNPNPNSVLLVVPTENRDKVRVVSTYFRDNSHPPAYINLPLQEPLKIRADSEVGEQPYDSAGPEGAFNRVVNAVRQLGAKEEYRRVLEENCIGSVIVGSVENFILRGFDGEGEGEDEGEGVGPVDYGFVVLCRVPVTSSITGTSGGGEDWVWRTGISRGVSVPVDYWREAERAGFDDETEQEEGERPRFGRVTVGSLLAKHAGLSSANWHEQLVGVSRYDLLAEAMGKMEAPWPGPVAAVKEDKTTGRQ